jgi:hypothetical protein
VLRSAWPASVNRYSTRGARVLQRDDANASNCRGEFGWVGPGAWATVGVVAACRARTGRIRERTRRVRPVRAGVRPFRRWQRDGTWQRIFTSCRPEQMPNTAAPESPGHPVRHPDASDGPSHWPRTGPARRHPHSQSPRSAIPKPSASAFLTATPDATELRSSFAHTARAPGSPTCPVSTPTPLSLRCPGCG